MHCSLTCIKKSWGGLSLALRASNSRLYFVLEFRSVCLWSRWWRFGKSVLLLKNLCRSGVGSQESGGRWSPGVGTGGGGSSLDHGRRRGCRKAFVRHWWLEGRQVIWSHCPRKLSATPWIMGAAVPFILCCVLASIKWKLLLLEVWIKYEDKKKGKCGKNWNLWNVSYHTFCKNPFPRVKTCLVVSQVRWKVRVGTGHQFGNAAGSLVVS